MSKLQAHLSDIERDPKYGVPHNSLATVVLTLSFSC